MKISNIAVNRPVTVAVLTVLLLAIAAFMVPDLSLEMMPDVEPPMVAVLTSFNGAGPVEVEQSVTEVLEKQLTNVSGLDSMTSTSSFDSSVIMLEFGFDQDLDEAVVDIRDALDVVENYLPDGADSPVIYQFDINGESIMRLVMEGEETADKLKELAEDIVQPRLERINGVASADITGGETRAARVDLSLNRLEAYGITASDIINALSNQNLQMSGGTLTANGMEYDLKIDERFTSIEDIARTVVATLNPELSVNESVNRSSVVRLEDVADVYSGTEDIENYFYINGNPGISVEVTNESDTNTIQIADAVIEALPSINAELPEGITVSVLYNNTTYIDSVLSQVYSSAWQGIILAVIILFLFLRSWRSTMIIGVSIPVSIVITLMLMYFFNITLNMMSLTGLILGLGMIVDNSIVILENIHQYRERGAKLRASAILGSQEMNNSITASTLTTLCVFLPIIIWKDGLQFVGDFFTDMIFTVVISLIVSYFTAVALVPALASRFIKLYSSRQRPIRNRFLASLERFGANTLSNIEHGYRRGLEFVLKNRLMIVTVVVVTLIFSVVSLSSLGISLMPSDSSDDTVTVSIEMPVGTTLERTQSTVLQFKDIIEEEVPEYEDLIISIGDTGSRRASGSYVGSIQILLPELENQTVSAPEVQEILRPFTTSIPDTEITFDSGRNFGTSDPVDVVVYSDDIDLASDTAAEIRDLMKEHIPQIVDPVTDLDEGMPEYRISIDKDRAAAYGLSVNEIATVINGLVDGSTPETYWEGTTELDIVVQLAEEDRTNLMDLDSLFISTSSGAKIALSNLASYTLQTGLSDINREDETRAVHVTADLVEGFGSTEAVTLIESVLEEYLILPDGVTYDFSGDRRDIKDMIPTLITVFIVALLMIFAVMAAQFESLVDPFIILFSIPLLIIGVVGVYFITGEVFSMFSVIGMVVLMGIVVNNGIVMVDYMNLLRKRGLPLNEAILLGTVSRLRPVLMTSLTTILSMVPMAFFPGEGTDMIRPIGQTIVGGLVSSTFITMFVTPTVYSLVNRDRKKKNDDDRPVEIVNKKETTA